MYEGRDLPDPIPPDPKVQPEAMQKLRDFHLNEDADGVLHLAEPTSEKSQRQRAHYYANVTMIDKQVGEIIEALERRGVLDDTIIIFTSDHGDSLGDHGHSQKWSHRSYCYRYRIAAQIGNTPDSTTTHQGFRIVWDL